MIYFLQAGASGPIKIGTTVDLEARLRSLRTANHEPLALLAVVAGGHELEAKIHRDLAQHRRPGEWFEPAAAVFEYLRQLQAPECVFDGGKTYAVLRRLSEESLTLPCPFCGRRHQHSPGDGHRAPHCVNPSHPEIRVGSILLRSSDGYIVKIGVPTLEP